MDVSAMVLLERELPTVIICRFGKEADREECKGKREGRRKIGTEGGRRKGKE